jgi:FkbM family methyltransferase
MSKEIMLPIDERKIYLRRGTTDPLDFVEVFIYEEFDVDFENDPEIIVDLGAYIGLGALYFKWRFPLVKIVCIEPDVKNFSLLTKNLTGLDGISIIHAAVWPEKSEVFIGDFLNLGSWGIVTRENNGLKEGDKVATITIDEILTRYSLEKIDLLKVNIEGSEKELFSSNYQNWLSKTNNVIIELHDWIKKGCSQSFIKAISTTFKDNSLKSRGAYTIIQRNDFKY